MPNWCSNELRISGDPEKIKSFMEANKGLPAQYVLTEWEQRAGYTYPTEPRFCFNALVPTPQDVIELGYYAHLKLSDISKKEGEDAISGMIELPHVDGYHWNIDNWGTKWDIWGQNVGSNFDSCGEEGLSEFSLCFGTAWSPPLPWLKKVAPMFPELTFELHYEEPGCYFAGDVYACGDEFQVDEYDDDRLRDLFLWDEEDEDEEDEEVE